MDDFVVSNLYESRNEWCARLVTILTPLVSEGIKSIFNESVKICKDNDEMKKYLMTFQNLLAQVPKWNSVIVEDERKRIIERSGCNYLEDLISCVHIIQLKVLTCIRVGNKQKKIDISIPKLDNFIHKVYIHVARKTYMNVYLFEQNVEPGQNNVTPLQIQKNNREFGQIVQECILITVRESIPTEDIIRAYMDESVEQEEEVLIENITEPVEEEPVTQDKNVVTAAGAKESEKEETPIVPSITNLDDEPVVTTLKFNDYDSILDSTTGKIEEIEAPKNIDRLEELSSSRAIQRQLEEEDDMDERIQIHTDNIDLNDLDIMDIGRESKLSEDVMLDDIITL
jgi:hypothetical protein